MKRLILGFVILLLAGCSTPKEYRAIQTGELYIGGSGTVSGQLPIGDFARPIQDAQIAGAGKTLVDTYDGYGYNTEGGYLHLFLGYQVSQAFDLEATAYTNSGDAHRFSNTYSLYDPRIDRPPLFGLHEARIDGELRDSGAMLTGLVNWRLHEYFHVFARLGASYSQTDLKSRLDEDTSCRLACSPATFVNQVEYRTQDIQPVWGIGITVSDVVRFEYLTRKLPISPTASHVTSAYGDFDTPKLGGSETFQSLMLTVRFGLGRLFSDEE